MNHSRIYEAAAQHCPVQSLVSFVLSIFGASTVLAGLTRTKESQAKDAIVQRGERARKVSNSQCREQPKVASKQARPYQKRALLAAPLPLLLREYEI